MNELNVLGFELVDLSELEVSNASAPGSNTCCLLFLTGCKNTTTEVQKPNN